MPEFLTEFIQDLNNKSSRIIENFENTKFNHIYKDIFNDFWMPYKLKQAKPIQNVIAIDSTRGICPVINGGFFYVVRSLALSKEKRYRKIYADFDFLNNSRLTNFPGIMMEWTEHIVAIDAIKDGFEGIILLDGSIYGRMSHLPIELELLSNRGFTIDYFETLIELIELCKKKQILLIGISKESTTSFFREFLIKEISKSLIPDSHFRKQIISLALDDRKKALDLAKKTGNQDIVILISELVNRKPDNLIIMNNASKPGYSSPLLLGASQRWHRRAKEISVNINNFIESQFPTLSEDSDFLKKAKEVISKVIDLPAIISFHLLPQLIDTPMRIDIPAYHFNESSKFLEFGWPEVINVNLDKVLELISAGYCGLDNYNIWLKAVDDEVKLKRTTFETLYLNKFEEIIGRYTTPRGYRRVRYP